VDLDSATKAKLRLLYPDLGTRIVRVFNSYFLKYRQSLRVTSGFRTMDKQRALYNSGRNEPGRIVTNAQPGRSFHNYGLALDVCVRGKDPYLKELDLKPRYERWRQFGRMAERQGFKWGGSFMAFKGDLTHVQLTLGLTIDEVQELYKYGGIRAVWAKLDQIRGVPIGLEWESLYTDSKIVEPESGS